MIVVMSSGGGITREARDDEAGMGKAEVRERGGVGAIVEARSARGGEEEEGALVSGDREKEACALSVDGVEESSERGGGSEERTAKPLVCVTAALRAGKRRRRVLRASWREPGGVVMW